MRSPLRIGIIGSGMMGCEHIRNIKLMPDAVVTALADPSEGSRDMALWALGAAKNDVQSFATPEALIETGGVDALIVASPNYTHRAVLEAGFASGLPILCEKPLCTTVADASWAAAQAARYPSVFWVGMEYRYMPPVAHFIAEIQAGRIGTLHMLAIREHRFPFLPKVGDWNRFARNTGGTMVEKCCHFFDLMRYIIGAEAVRVFCSGAMDVNHKSERYDGATPDIIDNSFTVVEFANGTRAMLDLCMFAEGARNQEELSAVGDKAKLEVFIPDSRVVFSPRVPLRAPKEVEERHIDVDAVAMKAGSHHGATYYQLRGFLDAVTGKGPVAVSAEDGLKAVALGAAAELSAREHRAVLIAELA